MAAGQIRISPEGMRMRASEYRAEGEKMADIIARMDSLLNSLKEEWEGSASEAYAEKYAELKPSFNSARELIGEIAAALDSTAAAVEETDSEIAGRFRV